MSELNSTSALMTSSNESDTTILIPYPLASQGTCIKFNNQSDPFHIGDRYGGIPLNLLTNFIGWIILLLLFVVIRKNVVRKRSLKIASDTVDSMDTVTTQWTQIFFRRDKSSQEASENTLEQNESEETLCCKDDDDKDIVDPVRHTDIDTEDESMSIGRTSNYATNAKIMTMKEKGLEGLVGSDAVQYLRFQKYIIIYIFLTTVVSLGVILPLNFQGTQLGNATDFGHTTLANLNPNDDKDSIILWIHVAIAFLMFPAAIFLMRRFSIGLKMTDTNLKITRTVAIENIPEKNCNIEDIKQHFSEAYPEFRIFDIQVVYNVSKLIELSLNLENVVDSKKFCKKYKTRHDLELEMIPVGGARCCKCFCLPCVNKVSCIEYFTEEEVKLRELIEKEGIEARKVPLGMAFVTFENINHARHVLRDHKNSILNFKKTAPESKLDMNPHKWRVWYAPLPNDIIWENLSNKRNWTLVKKIIANLFIFLVAFFLTTPQFVVHQLDPILNALKNLTFNPLPSPSEGNATDPLLEPFRDLPAWMTDFLPTLMIWTFTALLPVVVAYADLLVGHWTRSGQNHAIMKKTFWYLLFMVIILPTFGFTSSQAYINFLWKNNNLNWECIFLPDSGAFFVNYVITSAMIGSGLELIRFPELFWYLIQICMSRSKADTPAIRKAIIYEFRFGEQYARMMLIFAMVVMFSISCPLITPFGCLYFIFKHLVDRHNLAFVYARSRINKKVHATAINFVIMSVALLQFFMIVFSFIRSLDSDLKTINFRTKVSMALFILTLNVCSAQIWSNTCRRISPIKYEDVLLGEDPEDEHDQVYLPKVLTDSLASRRKSQPKYNKTHVDYQTF
eukprot:GFUD01010165.1.p1 GENE.GFUD01010165.1~~GFUD01010165.1.p1  ORF type:complete len:846 (+),score=190.82 GFUD01010165.1:77-2614(+)